MPKKAYIWKKGLIKSSNGSKVKVTKKSSVVSAKYTNGLNKIYSAVSCLLRGITEHNLTELNIPNLKRKMSRTISGVVW
jgi:hypothetical protein